jgi:hypothetical protein
MSPLILIANWVGCQCSLCLLRIILIMSADCHACLVAVGPSSCLLIQGKLTVGEGSVQLTSSPPH